MLGVPLMIMGAAKQAVAKKIDKRARKDLREAMGNVAGAMGGGAGAPAFARDKEQLGAFRTRILAQEEKRRAKENNSPKKRVKSDLPDNSPNALEIGLKKAKEKREAEESAMERKKDKGVKFTPKTGPNAGEQVIFRMKGMPPILREPTAKQKANLPPNLIKAIEDAPPLERYNSETMEMEQLKPVNRSALQMIGRKGDNIPMMRSYGTPYTKRSAAGKAKLMKTKYGQTGKAIPTNQLIKPIFKKAKGKK